MQKAKIVLSGLAGVVLMISGAIESAHPIPHHVLIQEQSVNVVALPKHPLQVAAEKEMERETCLRLAAQSRKAFWLQTGMKSPR